MRSKSKTVPLLLGLLAIVLILSPLLAGCTPSKGKKVVIYTSSDENEIALARKMLDERFPQYQISLEYLSTGNHAAKLKAEGLATECDISYDLEYGYMETLDGEGLFADLAGYDSSIFLDELAVSPNYIPTMRYGGAVIVNTRMLDEAGLAKPVHYEDLLDPAFRGLISMPSPKASGTGYMFYKSLVNAWGQEKALTYFDQLAENILQFPASGSGPVNSLVLNEIAVGLGMTSHAALKITEGNPLEIIFFEEGSPYAACGTAIIRGKEARPEVQEVFRYFYQEITPAICRELYPEQIYKDLTFEMENYPSPIPYADMSNDTPEEKERLLQLWEH